MSNDNLDNNLFNEEANLQKFAQNLKGALDTKEELGRYYELLCDLSDFMHLMSPNFLDEFKGEFYKIIGEIQEDDT